MQNWNFIENSLLNHVFDTFSHIHSSSTGTCKIFSFKKEKSTKSRANLNENGCACPKWVQKWIFQNFSILHTFWAICSIFQNLTFLTFMTSNIIQGQAVALWIKSGSGSGIPAAPMVSSRVFTSAKWGSPGGLPSSAQRAQYSAPGRRGDSGRRLCAYLGLGGAEQGPLKVMCGLLRFCGFDEHRVVEIVPIGYSSGYRAIPQWWIFVLPVNFLKIFWVFFISIWPM